MDKKNEALSHHTTHPSRPHNELCFMHEVAAAVVVVVVVVA